jgi:hypothetical protein
MLHHDYIGRGRQSVSDDLAFVVFSMIYDYGIEMVYWANDLTTSITSLSPPPTSSELATSTSLSTGTPDMAILLVEED